MVIIGGGVAYAQATLLQACICMHSFRDYGYQLQLRTAVQYYVVSDEPLLDHLAQPWLRSSMP